jgi:hypothetical protein
MPSQMMWKVEASQKRHRWPSTDGEVGKAWDALEKHPMLLSALKDLRFYLKNTCPPILRWTGYARDVFDREPDVAAGRVDLRC